MPGTVENIRPINDQSQPAERLDNSKSQPAERLDNSKTRPTERAGQQYFETGLMNWRLIFSGFKSPGWAAYAIVSVALAIGLSVWLMRLERKLVSRTVGWTLMTLRLLVLMTLLATLLQPVLTKQFDVAQRGRVVVAIDGSLSMETQDRHASLAEKLRWAQALGMLGNEETRPLIDKWVTAAEAGKEPNWLGTDGAPENPTEQALSDARARQIRDSLQELETMPRVEFVRRLLQSPPRKLLDRLEDVMPVDLRLFAMEQQTTSAKELAAILQSKRADLVPGGTDALQMLQAVTSEEGADEIRAFVVLSDGRQTAPGDVAGSGQRLASLGVPVYSIPIGSRRPPRDLSIAAIDAPEAVFLNDKAQIQAVIGTYGFEGEPLIVRLERDGLTVDQQKVTPATDTATVSFSVPSDKPGRYEYRVTTDVQQGELREDNNAREISLLVVDNKARVMLVEGDARWEFRYLKNLLDRDRQVEPLTVLFRQPYIDLLNQSFIPSKLPDIEAFKEQLARTEMLVVGDVGPVDVESGIWELIEQAVARDGLTLVVIPGRRHMPQDFDSSKTLSALLPIREFRQRLAEQFQVSVPDADQSVFQLNPTPESSILPMFQLSPDPAARDATLSELPGHPWVYGATPKPGANVWATASIPGVQIDPEPVIIHHDYGFGQVVWMGVDSTWRWRRRAGDTWHYRFWGQMIRWAARNKSSAGNDDVRMTLSDVVIDESESVEAVVRWNPKLLPQLQGATVEVVATLIAPETVQGEIPEKQKGRDTAASNPEQPLVTLLQPSPDVPERFIGRLPRLTSGAWRVQLKVTDGTIAMKEMVQGELLVQKQASAELANVSCNRDLLTQLSELSGGKLIEPFEAERLIDLVQPKDQAEQKIQERSLWDHWLILLVFFTLLTSEWVIRKLSGLP